MKVLLSILISACLAVTVISISKEHQEFKDRRVKAVEECRKEKPDVSDEDFAAVKNKDEPKNQIQHCIFECVYGKMGILKDGKLNKEEINKVTKARYSHNATLFNSENWLSQSCQFEVEQSYDKIGKCQVPNAYHSCVAKKRKQQEQQKQQQEQHKQQQEQHKQQQLENKNKPRSKN